MMNVVSSLCVSETDGESLWTTIACRQGPWHICLEQPPKILQLKIYIIKRKNPHVCLLADRLLSVQELHCLCAGGSVLSLSSIHLAEKHDPLHLLSFPSSQLPSPLYPFLCFPPSLLMLCASQCTLLQRHCTAENKKCFS